MKWGFNRRLNPQEIQVVPMVTPSSMLFLDWALSGRNELTLKVMYGLKRALRDTWPAEANRRPRTSG
jgi:hypothetical protein